MAMPTKRQTSYRPNRSGVITFEEFCDIVPEHQKADLIDGVIYLMPPDNTDANDLFVWLACLLYDFAEYHDLGKVYGSRVAFRLDKKNAPEPDIAFVRKDRLNLVQRGHIAGAADLAVEIVSPESVQRDYVKKRKLYEKHGFAEYWIVDEELERVTLYRRDAAGKFQEIAPKKGVYASTSLPDFWLRPEWLWIKSRVRKADALSAILAGPPSK
jgi:Uma2 family endonuclease